LPSPGLLIWGIEFETFYKLRELLTSKGRLRYLKTFPNPNTTLYVIMIGQCKGPAFGHRRRKHKKKK
jgi:hypothetical protein